MSSLTTRSYVEYHVNIFNEKDDLVTSTCESTFHSAVDRAKELIAEKITSANFDEYFYSKIETFVVPMYR